MCCSFIIMCYWILSSFGLIETLKLQLRKVNLATNWFALLVQPLQCCRESTVM